MVSVNFQLLVVGETELSKNEYLAKGCEITIKNNEMTLVNLKKLDIPYIPLISQNTSYELEIYTKDTNGNKERFTKDKITILEDSGEIIFNNVVLHPRMILRLIAIFEDTLVIQYAPQYTPKLSFIRENSKWISECHASILYETNKMVNITNQPTLQCDLDCMQLSIHSMKSNNRRICFPVTEDPFVVKLTISNTSKDFYIFLKEIQNIPLNVADGNTAYFEKNLIYLNYLLAPQQEKRFFMKLTDIDDNTNENNRAIELMPQLMYVVINENNYGLTSYSKPKYPLVIYFRKKIKEKVKDPLAKIFRTFHISNLVLRNKIKKTLAPLSGSGGLLAAIIIIFPNYTNHGLDHSIRVIDYMKKLVDACEINLNDYEKFLLVEAALLHDVGLSYSPAVEYYKKNSNNNSYKYLMIYPISEKIASKSQNKIRKLHPKIGRRYVESHFEEFSLTADEGKLIGQIIELHSIPSDIPYDPLQQMDVSVPYPATNIQIRPRLIASLLRLADELDLDKRRKNEKLYGQLHTSQELRQRDYFYFGIHEKIEKVKILCKKSENKISINIFTNVILKKEEVSEVIRNLEKMPIKNAFNSIGVYEVIINFKKAINENTYETYRFRTIGFGE